ncbi:DUF1338 family protein [Novosphingobium sp. G106]|uniref:2-oxoadipate dioxygenase/decarboxylase family protein n=1 Tax=Novosphingobium sp. G106 TaxID=2849500 RepID=UPI001C2D0DFF|nr:DUF1338 family protein [Novosphingobium sp. G106]MBV1688761.1 DUF1338 family protein [Novosphingobium sp. G106]
MIPQGSAVLEPVAALLGEARAGVILAGLEIDPLLAKADGVTRAQAAMALNAVLFAQLLDRVPTAARYAAAVFAEGRQICFDHGALRTIDGATGTLPRGRGAFARLLEPLGYRVGGVYPLPRLKMTGHVFTHADFPETVPQFFVSELHVEQLPESAQAAAQKVFGASADPLDGAARSMLDALARDGRCTPEQASAGLPALVGAFGRHHADPALSDYEALLEHSAEAAWMATEGNAFNHATDRVPDVEALAATLKDQGYPLKPAVEHSTNGRVHQTAFLADKVMRIFIGADGQPVTREVPGSFYEFITRDLDPTTGRLDLSFDSGNATGIFAMTEAR